MVKFPWVVRAVSVMLWIIPVAFFGYLGFQYTAISGTYTYIWTPQENPEKNIQPLGRASKPLQDVETGEVFQRISGDPVYLSVEVPRTFEQVTATVDLHNSGQPLVELGLQNSEEWKFDLHPLDVPMLEELNWFTLVDKGNVLLQREKQFSSIQEFLDHLPLDQGIAEYYQNLDPEFLFDDFTPQPNLHLTSPLRGAHIFHGFVQSQPVSLDISYVDLNRAFDDDAVTLSIIQHGVVLAQAIAADDGNVIADGQVSNQKTLHVATEAALDGEFILQLTSTDDLLVTSVETNFGYLVAKRLFLAGNTEYRAASAQFNTAPTVLTTNTTLLQAVTSHPVNLQTVEVSQEELTLVTVNTTQSLDLPDASIKTIRSPQNDVTLTTLGWMSFTPESFFDPDYLIERLTPATDLERIDFIYASDLPQHAVTETVRSVTFDLAEVPGDKKQLNFIVSAPGLDQRKAELAVSSIRFEFHRPPLTLRGIFIRLYQRLFS